MQHTAIARPRPLIVAHLLLLLAERARHGYELAESLRTSEFEGVTTSTVYRELARLEEDGLVRSFWQASQARGPARHMYELTPAGRDDLGRCADDVRALITHLHGFLAAFEGLDGNGHHPDDPAPNGKPRRRLWKPR
jgi:PadR family transcriptional regulator, regulatory protein PadR